jgi:hypothetical protein
MVDASLLAWGLRFALFGLAAVVHGWPSTRQDAKRRKRKKKRRG